MSFSSSEDVRQCPRDIGTLATKTHLPFLRCLEVQGALHVIESACVPPVTATLFNGLWWGGSASLAFPPTAYPWSFRCMLVWNGESDWLISDSIVWRIELGLGRPGFKSHWASSYQPRWLNIKSTAHSCREDKVRGGLGERAHDMKSSQNQHHIFRCLQFSSPTNPHMSRRRGDLEWTGEIMPSSPFFISVKNLLTVYLSYIKVYNWVHILFAGCSRTKYVEKLEELKRSEYRNVSICNLVFQGFSQGWWRYGYSPIHT